VSSIPGASDRFTIDRLPELVRHVQAGVVHIDFTGPAGGGNGSGFSIEPLAGDVVGGIVITNAHVANGADELRVRFSDGREQRASIRVCDDSSDLAILTVAEPAPAVLPLRSLVDVQVGEYVIAIGSPYGLEGTVTAGIISGLDRTMPAPNRVPIENMVQTDASINPGNSGGPLIGLDGRVIGVNDQTLIGADHLGTGLGFAIPSDTLKLIYEEIVETGQAFVTRASIATRTVLRRFDADERQHFGQKAGAAIVSPPRPDTPAARAGLRQGDIIVALNDVVVDEPGDLFAALNRRVIGVECTIAYLRDQQRQTTTIVPIPRAQPERKN
jgi:serine protease Do